MTSQTRVVTIYSSDGLPMYTLCVDRNTKQVVFPSAKKGQLLVDIDAKDRVFFPLNLDTLCLGHG